jgi:pimeloyl-ACP methyl ester carboxylesterase
VTLHYGAREAVAKAIAFAPNANRPAPDPGATPSVLALRGVRSLETRAGPPDASIVSWVVEARGARRGTVVLLHGVRMNKQSLVPVGAALSDAGYRAVLVDLRGHGESTGRYLTYGAVEARDVAAVFDALPMEGRECVGVYGFSYGAAVAIQLSARDERVRAVVAVASFSSLREVTLDYRQKYLPVPFSLIPDTWFQGALDEAGQLAAFDPDGAAPVRALERSSARVLLIHGAADTQVPLRHGRELAAAAGSRAELVVVPGATHDSIPNDPSGVVRRSTIDWFDRWLDRSVCGTTAD